MTTSHPAHGARRLFLQQAGALSALTGAGAPLLTGLLAGGSALAQTAPDYRAIVCVFLFGGNDAYNMVLATDGHNGAGAPTPGREAGQRPKPDQIQEGQPMA